MAFPQLLSLLIKDLLKLLTLELTHWMFVHTYTYTTTVILKNKAKSG